MDMEKLNGIVEPLLVWFGDNARVLPWREQPLPYYVWVSEIMLQQTRVEAVKPFFARFIEALPDVASLAACPEEKLLKLWEGLGYYNRVRNMQKAAQLVMERYDGRLPDTYEELLALPGIGSYTAGAVASIAYGRAVPAVDGNVLRVISRISGDDQDVMKQSVRKQYEEALRGVMERVWPEDSQQKRGQTDLPEEQTRINGSTGENPGQKVMRGNTPGTFNQALMELGATVCLPNGAPDCDGCPVRQICYARANGCQMELPVKAAKKARRIEQRTVLVIRDSEHAMIRRRPAKGLLAGLYELPNLEGHLTQEEVLDQVRSWGFSSIRIRQLPEAKHIFSHIEWQMTGYMVLVEDLEEADRSAGHAAPENEGVLFIEPQHTEREYPIPAAFAAYTKYLSIRLGQEKYREIEVE
jgi:A/G-specific adenine glycosylase